jgi:hypothetical protein
MKLSKTIMEPISFGKNLELTTEPFSTATIRGMLLLKKKTNNPKTHRRMEI